MSQAGAAGLKNSTPVSGYVLVTLIFAMCVTLLAGCRGSHASHASTGTKTLAIPPPPYARLLPTNYRAQKVWRASLTGGSVPEAIISSVGPLSGSLGFHAADLQVLSWDTIARHWTVVFDAEKVVDSSFSSSPGTSNDPPELMAASGETRTTPLLDPKADVRLDAVRFAHLLPGPGEQLVFTETSSYGGSGIPGELVVVDFKRGVANLAYVWAGDGGVRRFQVAGRRIAATAAEFWTSSDAHCCPARGYRFSVAPVERTRYLTEISDQRPWLGAYLRPITAGDPSSPVRVVGVVQGSPAASVLGAGDILLSVENAHKLRNQVQDLLGPAIYDQIDTFNAGETAKLLVRRGGTEIAVSVKLGSLSDKSVSDAFPPNSYTVSTL